MRLTLAAIVGLLSAVMLTGCRAAAVDSMPAPSSDNWSLEVEQISPVDNSTKAIADTCNRPAGSGILVTFDDSGSPEQVKAILKTLDELNWKGAFFPIGKWALDNWDLIEEIQKRGHIVGSHTMTHPDLEDLLEKDSDAFFSEIYPLKDFATTSPMLLRPPFGSGLDNSEVAKLMTERNIQMCGWRADTNDWRGGTPEEMLKRIMEGYEHSERLQPDGVVLMHIHGKHTPEFLRLLASELDARDWKRTPLEK